MTSPAEAVPDDDKITPEILKIAGVVVLGAIMSILDITVVNVALPTFQTELSSNGEPIAFAVDRMLGRHEVVVRPIEDMLARMPGIAGATDLGDGRPTLLLDLIELGGGISDWRAEVSS